jgi:hypothetical protein
MSDGLWLGALGVILAAVVTALATAWIAKKDREMKEKIAAKAREMNELIARRELLIADCKLAARDLQRFRKLEDLYASELAQIKGEKPETLRKKMRRQLKDVDQIGDYGEPKRISNLVSRLTVA